MKQLLYDYHKLVELDASKINGIWRGIQIFLFGLSTFFSILCVIFIQIMFVSLDHNCFLFPKNITYRNQSQSSNDSNTTHTSNHIPVHFINSQWADYSVCSLPFNNPIMSVIFSIIWTAFFIMCSGIKKPWRIVIPAFVFCFIYGILCIVFTATLQNGMKEFSLKFNNMTRPENSFDDENINHFNIYVLLSVASAWMYTVLWCGAVVWLLLRVILVADFQLVHVKVELIKNTPDATSMLSDDFTPNESPTFPIHTVHSEQKESPKILKQRPKMKKFVNVPTQIIPSSSDTLLQETDPGNRPKVKFITESDISDDTVNATIESPLNIGLSSTSPTNDQENDSSVMKSSQPYTVFQIDPKGDDTD